MLYTIPISKFNHVDTRANIKEAMLLECLNILKTKKKNKTAA